MINLKSNEEIAIMADAGKRLRRVVKDLKTFIKPGITTNQINKKAEQLIIAEGGEPGFKKVDDYEWAICIPVNEQIVHTPPSDRKLLDGDLLTVDIGLYLKGYHTDFATSFIVGPTSSLNRLGTTLGASEVEKFLNAGRDTIDKAIKQARVGNHIGHISKTIQDGVEGKGYSVSDTLVGHGIGHKLHEDPLIPGILQGKIEKTPIIKAGMVIAIEVIYMMGNKNVELEKEDDWSIKTSDDSLSACFEQTVAVTEKGPVILT
ncbi:MAG: type I methionyl aminopeptidase [Patescibacteria group bacterium]